MRKHAFLISLLAFSFALTAGAATIIDTLPTGVKWVQGVNYEIPYSVWSKRTNSMIACSNTITASSPAQCSDTQYVWDANHKINVNGTTYQCTRVASPDKCSTSAYIPAAQRASAKCTVVRTHTTASSATDLRACAACSGGSCDFFLGTGAISLTNPTATTQPTAPTTPTTPTTPTAPTTPSTGSSGGVQGGTPGGVESGVVGGNGANPDADGDGCPDNFNLLPKGVCTLSGVIDILLSLVVQIGSMLLVVALVWTGFLFIKAQGAEEELRSARSALLWVVLGGLLLLGAQALSLVISATVESL